MSIRTRLVELGDAEQLSEALTVNRAFLAPSNPLHPDEYFTVDVQRNLIAAMLQGHEDGLIVPQVITSDDRIIGQIFLAPIIRDVLQCATVGYWVAQTENGRGHASAAVAQVCMLAFGELDLHRLDAPVQQENTGWQSVLKRNGFTQYGLAHRYAKLAGRWQDCIMFERLADNA